MRGTTGGLRGMALTLAVTAAATSPVAGQEKTEPDVPYVPTPISVVRQMLELAGAGAGDTVYDLGSGDGRIVITAAKEFGARGVGVEIDPELVAEARRNARTEQVEDRVRFIQGDLFETDVSGATAVTMYLLHSVNLRLRHRLLAQLAPGTPLVSHDFGMGDWKPDTTVRMDSVSANVHRWTVPAEVAGLWRIHLPGGRSARLEIDQSFQEVEATLRRGTSDSTAVPEITLHGDRIRMVLPAPDDGGSPVRLEGRVDGDRVRGSVAGGGRWDGRRIRRGSGWPKEPPWPYREEGRDAAWRSPGIPWNRSARTVSASDEDGSDGRREIGSPVPSRRAHSRPRSEGSLR